MKTKSILFLLILLSFLSIQAQLKNAIVSVDHQQLISRADLNYNQPVTKSEEGMPLGNGRMGSLVWTTPASINFQLNRVDVFGNDSNSDNFFERHSDYCGGVGAVSVDFVNYGEEVFTGEHFNQHLSCYDGLVTVNGKGVEAKVITWHEKDIMALQIMDSRSDQQSIDINLSMLRSPIMKRGDHLATSDLKIINNRIVLTQKFQEDDYYNASAVMISVSGRDVKAKLVNDFTVQLTTSTGNDPFSIYMATSASFDPGADLVANVSEQLDVAVKMGFQKILESNKEWWHRFWEKSFVHLHSEDGKADFIEKNYTYYLYVMASASRGKYPPKFNGMLWTTGGDSRKWGNLYWGANQSCLYNALFPTNHLELMDPMFDMYSSMYHSCELAAQQQWGSKGIFIPETVGFAGIPALPDEIAEEMRALYLLEKPWSERSEAFDDYAFTKMPYLSRWNWKADAGWKDGLWHITDKGGGTFGHVTHIFSRGAKIAYQYWMRYEYTHDETWLRERAYPMLKGVAEFYRNFPNLRKETDGKYHIYHVNDNEAIWDAHNTVEEIASMMGIFPTLIHASEILNVDAEMRPIWKEFIDHLSPLPLNTDYPDRMEEETKLRWVKSLPGAMHGNGYSSPDPNTMPIWFFDLVTLESQNPVLIDIANNTYDSYFRNGINASTDVNVLSKLPAIGALLGRTDATRYLIPNQINTAETEVMSNRMDLREGFQTTSVQRLGRAADALHNALCQSVPPGPGQEPIIHVFPAWPPEWDAQFTLLCRGGFLVTSSRKDASVEFVEIYAQQDGLCKVRNPWKDAEVDIYRNGKKEKAATGKLLELKTKKGDSWVITLRGTNLNTIKEQPQQGR